MTETKDTTDKTLRSGARKPMSLQRTVESGHVRQNFSHGRSKSVVVEKRKTRKLTAPGAEAEKPSAPAELGKKPAAEAAPRSSAPAPAATQAEQTRARMPPMTQAEQEARSRALEAARKREAEERERAAEQERTQAAALKAEPKEPAPAPAPAPEAELKPVAAAPAAPPAAPAEAQPATPTVTKPAHMPREGGRPKEITLPVTPRRQPGQPAPEVAKRPEARARPPAADGADEEEVRGGVKRKVTRAPTKALDERRERVKLTINNFDREAQERSLASLRRKQ